MDYASGSEIFFGLVLDAEGAGEKIGPERLGLIQDKLREIYNQYPFSYIKENMPNTERARQRYGFSPVAYRGAD